MYLSKHWHTAEVFTWIDVLQMFVEAGLAYAVIVDGFNGNFGEYSLSINANDAQVPIRSPDKPLACKLMADTLHQEKAVQGAAFLWERLAEFDISCIAYSS